VPTSTHSDTDREGGGEMREGGEVGGREDGDRKKVKRAGCGKR
jgi:hypothetical protein